MKIERFTVRFDHFVDVNKMVELESLLKCCVSVGGNDHAEKL
jgi:hypothetical protein